MKYNDDEFLEMRAQFEKDAKKNFYAVRLDHETRGKCPNRYFYEHGETNELFRAYMLGYSLGKSIWAE
jgi:hypothetical protein